MNRKYIILLMFIVLAVLMVFAIKIFTSNPYLQEVKRVSQEIKIDIDALISGKKEFNRGMNEEGIIQMVQDYVDYDFFTRTKTEPSDYNIEYFREEYTVKKSPITMRLTVYPDDAKFYEYYFSNSIKRDIGEEKEQIINKADGNYHGDVWIFGKHKLNYTIKTIGNKKVKCFDLIDPNADVRIYRLFAGKYSIYIWYMYQDLPRSESPNKYNYETSEIEWDEINLENFKGIEEIIASIEP